MLQNDHLADIWKKRWNIALFQTSKTKGKYKKLDTLHLLLIDRHDWTFEKNPEWHNIIKFCLVI